MILDIAELVAGLVAVTLGANWLTDGASSIARRLGVTDFLIGMTIVAIGTSLPELVVSLFAALNGSADLSIGNIVGSNICNIFLILGLTALIVPIPLTRANVWFDIPVTLVISLLFAFVALDPCSSLDGFSSLGGVVSRIDGAILLVLYVAFLLYMIRTSRKESDSSGISISETGEKSHSNEDMKTWKAVVLTLIGFAFLTFGARLFVNGATAVAVALNVSEAVIGLTIVAIGTSLPELAASLVAAIKGKSEMAIGNVLGSNIANILLIIGVSSVVSPLHLSDISLTDFAVMLLGPVILIVFPLVFRSGKVSRFEAFLLFAVYVAYTVYLIQNANPHL